MIIYSIVPEEIIYAQNKDGQIDIKNIIIDDGVILELRHCKNGIYEIIRLISTNPLDYLNDIYQPGTNIRISKFI